MPVDSNLRAILRQFASRVADRLEVTDVLYELCDHAVTVLDATGAGVSVANSTGELRFVTATSEAVVEMERVQADHQQGPSVDAFRSGHTRVVTNAAELDQWPSYRDAATNLGLISVAGVPLALNDQSVGALNVYAAEERSWSAETLESVQVLADIATSYVLRAGELAEAHQLNGQLQNALHSRVIIEQAKGMLASEHCVSVDDAFEMLRNHSRQNNVPLRLVAQAVVRLELEIPRAS
jgi:transcriptional regulator with GAF, ATPase, and Fis domain